jgi:hypothetical protein
MMLPLDGPPGEADPTPIELNADAGRPSAFW